MQTRNPLRLLCTYAPLTSVKRETFCEMDPHSSSVPLRFRPPLYVTSSLVEAALTATTNTTSARLRRQMPNLQLLPSRSRMPLRRLLFLLGPRLQMLFSSRLPTVTRTSAWLCLSSSSRPRPTCKRSISKCTRAFSKTNRRPINLASTKGRRRGRRQGLPIIIRSQSAYIAWAPFSCGAANLSSPSPILVLFNLSWGTAIVCLNNQTASLTSTLWTSDD